MDNSQLPATAWDSNYSFKTRDLMNAAVYAERWNIKLLARSVTFDDFQRLMDIADDKAFDTDKGDYKWEWKLGTLMKYLDGLTEKEYRSPY